MRTADIGADGGAVIIRCGSYPRIDFQAALTSRAAFATFKN